MYSLHIHNYISHFGGGTNRSAVKFAVWREKSVILLHQAEILGFLDFLMMRDN